MTTPTPAAKVASKGCSTCGDRDGHGAVEAAECQLWAAVKDDVRALAAQLDNPPKAAAVDDLLAHLFSRYADRSRAHEAARVVLELPRHRTENAAMSEKAQDEFVQEFNRIQRGIESFGDEMRAKGIHVGVGAATLTRCVTCGESWPCAASKRAR